jgi:hypothetical protein
VTTRHRPRPLRPARTTRLVLSTITLGTVAALLLAGCSSAPEGPARPAAARGVTDSAGSVAPSPSAGVEASDVSASTGTVAPAVPGSTSTPPAATSAGHSPSAAPVADIGPSLDGIDRALAELDQELTDTDHDVATPEGDIR